MNLRLFARIGALLILGLTACQNDRPRGPRGGTGDAPMTANGELATPDPKPMDAQATFFNGQLGVEAMLAKSDAGWKNAEPPNAGERDGGRGGFRGGMGGMGNGGRGGGRRGGGPPPQSVADGAPRSAAIHASNAPPIQLRLRLTNRSDQPVDIEVLDFNSELGNFAVQPTKVTIPAHGSAEVDPMTSRLGVPAVEEIPLTVRIRTGGKNGKTETQVLKLKPRDESAPPAAT